MDTEHLASLFTGPREGGRGFNRIGLYNVRRRILLSFDPPCTLEVDSFPGAGTVVRIIIPVLAATTTRKAAFVEETDTPGEAPP
jgi:sensor histidine kinase YesM